ncbi:uncharacterized protein LOC106650467 isoform X2 [Trichogramma pretiosum]|uniref:uncharacterized protein LOC106650467 isoform X2 n=1 Tax=Trichogramma pretiosum TaxID=7493 RepID=UPI000C71B322|nr:uncharacterized protein LOC106650467 isoform X2 [Trichogramma pretiosum]
MPGLVRCQATENVLAIPLWLHRTLYNTQTAVDCVYTYDVCWQMHRKTACETWYLRTVYSHTNRRISVHNENEAPIHGKKGSPHERQLATGHIDAPRVLLLSRFCALLPIGVYGIDSTERLEQEQTMSRRSRRSAVHFSTSRRRPRRSTATQEDSSYQNENTIPKTVISSTDERELICCFCGGSQRDETLYGPFHEHEGIITHYFCLLLSSNVTQNGEDKEGILGFLAADINKEIRRGKRLFCSYCRKNGATLGCCETKCKKMFHLPCGLKNNSLHLFYGEFKSFCESHRPKQKIDAEILAKIANVAMVTCTICYEDVDPKDTIGTLWSSCCRKGAWFHRTCLQKLAISAGYFFKCPLCNNRQPFRDIMKENGIYVPEQDASWELVPNAYQELYYRHDNCNAKTCLCPKGRKYKEEQGKWLLSLCDMCGHQGTHLRCSDLKSGDVEWFCSECISITEKKESSSVENDTANDQSLVSSENFTQEETEILKITVNDDDSDSNVSVGNNKIQNDSLSSILSKVSLRPGPLKYKLKQVAQLKSAGNIEGSRSKNNSIIDLDSDNDELEIVCESTMKKRRENLAVIDHVYANPHISSDEPMAVTVSEETDQSPFNIVITNVTSVPPEFFNDELDSEEVSLPFPLPISAPLKRSREITDDLKEEKRSKRAKLELSPNADINAVPELLSPAKSFASRTEELTNNTFNESTSNSISDSVEDSTKSGNSSATKENTSCNKQSQLNNTSNVGARITDCSSDGGTSKASRQDQHNRAGLITDQANLKDIKFKVINQDLHINILSTKIIIQLDKTQDLSRKNIEKYIVSHQKAIECSDSTSDLSATINKSLSLGDDSAVEFDIAHSSIATAPIESRNFLLEDDQTLLEYPTTRKLNCGSGDLKENLNPEVSNDDSERSRDNSNHEKSGTASNKSLPKQRSSWRTRHFRAVREENHSINDGSVGSTVSSRSFAKSTNANLDQVPRSPTKTLQLLKIGENVDVNDFNDVNNCDEEFDGTAPISKVNTNVNKIYQNVVTKSDILAATKLNSSTRDHNPALLSEHERPQEDANSVTKTKSFESTFDNGISQIEKSKSIINEKKNFEYLYDKKKSNDGGDCDESKTRRRSRRKSRASDKHDYVR